MKNRLHEREVMYERGSVKRKLRSCMWLRYSLYKNEYRSFQPVEITTIKGTKVERRKIEQMNQFGL
jgi:hypothetical protein